MSREFPGTWAVNLNDMSDDKAKHNHTGQQPTDVPSEKLIHPPKKKGRRKIDRDNGFNSTGKDPTLGNQRT